MNVISWEAIEAITQGRFGRVMAPCPLCSASRRTAIKRNSKVLAATLVRPDFAIFYCNHCGASGYAHREGLNRKPIDQKQLQRQREAADRFAHDERRLRTQQALRLWDQAQQFRGTLAENYLCHTRNIGDWLDTFGFIDQVFRFHPDCPFGGERHPCLIALVRNIKDDCPCAIHRTALTKDAQKIGRRSLGLINGGAIKISADFEVHSGLMVGEGIETVLSASKHFQFRPVWSLIDAGNLAKFPPLSGLECLTIAVDNDANGTGQNAAAECSDRYLKANIEVIKTTPTRVKDFNELVMRNA